MKKLHLAQFNIGRMLGPLDGPVMRGFVERLDEINALADGTPGFVWRLHGPTPFAFSWRTPFPPDKEVLRTTDWSAFEPCPAV